MERCVEVKQVIDQWLDSAYRYLKLRGDDDGIYILRYTIDKDIWEMTLFDSHTKCGNRLSFT